MEDLTKLTLDEARERLKQAGVGSIITYPSQINKYKITSFDAVGDPCTDMIRLSRPLAPPNPLFIDIVISANNCILLVEANKTALFYPPIGSIWKNAKVNTMQIEITEHDKNIKGKYTKDTVQYIVLSGLFRGALDSMPLVDFYKRFEKASATITNDVKATWNMMDLSSFSGSSQTNDGRTHCYACGALTRVVNTGFSNSTMRVCTKCKK